MYKVTKMMRNDHQQAKESNKHTETGETDFAQSSEDKGHMC